MQQVVTNSVWDSSVGDGGGYVDVQSLACVSNQNKFLTTASTTPVTLWPYANSNSDYSYGNLVSGPYDTTGMVCLAQGVCGADNGQTLAAPPTQLCSSGSPQNTNGTGPWTWECAGAGIVASCSANIVAPTVTLTGPVDVVIPGPVVLSWNSQNANACTASGDWSGAKPVSGSETVLNTTAAANRGTRTYKLTCSNGGRSAVSTVAVTVRQIPSCTFTAAPAAIVPPQSSRLSWSCNYANSCTLAGSAVNAQNGSLTVRPANTTTYTLTCTSPDATVPFTQTVSTALHPHIQEVNP